MSALRRTYWPEPATEDRKLIQAYATRTYQCDQAEEAELNWLAQHDHEVADLRRDQIPSRMTQHPRGHVGAYKVAGKWVMDGQTVTGQELSPELTDHLTFQMEHRFTVEIAKLQMEDRDREAYVVYVLVTPNFPFGRGWPIDNVARVLGISVRTAHRRLARGREFIARRVTSE